MRSSGRRGVRQSNLPANRLAPCVSLAKAALCKPEDGRERTVDCSRTVVVGGWIE